MVVMCIFLRAALSASWNTFLSFLLLEASCAIGFWASPFLLAFFFLWSPFLSCFPLDLPSTSHCQMMMFHLGCHPRSSSVDNCCFAPAFNDHVCTHAHYCAVNTLLVGTCLLGPVLLTSKWMSSFECSLHPSAQCFKKWKKPFYLRVAFLPGAPASEHVLDRSPFLILARLLNLFFLPYHIG